MEWLAKKENLSEEKEPFIPEKSINLSHDSIPYYPQNQPKIRLISRTQHKFNVERQAVPSKTSFGDYYHSLLDLTWWKLLLGFSVIWLFSNLIFASLFYIDSSGLNTDGDAATFWTCFFFSVQTSETIGFGQVSPHSIYINAIVAMEAYFSLIRTAVVTGFVFAKISRPSRLSRHILFTDVGVIQQGCKRYIRKENKYEFNKDYYTIQFRVANSRKSQLCQTRFSLILLRREWVDGTPVELDSLHFRSSSVITRMHELNFEINDQVDHIRESQMSFPFLTLPTIISHVVDETSPFFPMNLEKFHKYDFELITLVDGVDEGVSHSVQARWSYLPEEFVWNHTFVNIVQKDKKTGKYVVDFSKFNSLVSTNIEDRFSTNSNDPRSSISNLAPESPSAHDDLLETS